MTVLQGHVQGDVETEFIVGIYELRHNMTPSTTKCGTTVRYPPGCGFANSAGRERRNESEPGELREVTGSNPPPRLNPSPG